MKVIQLILVLNNFVQTNTTTVYLTRNQMSTRAMIALMFYVATVTSSKVHESLPISDHEYPLMHYTKLISEEHFTAGRPIVVVLPITEEDSTNKEVEYLIKELHTSGRWPVLVYNVGYKMNGNMYTEIHPHGSYIILISVPCKEWEEHISRYFQQLHDIFVGNSWNPRAKFVVSVISNCTHLENKQLSRAILNELWFKEVINATVLFLKSTEHEGNDLQHNTNDSAQGTYLELHTWYPYENSERCNPAEGTVPVQVFTVRNLSDIRRSDIFRGFYGMNFHGCLMKVNVRSLPPLVNNPRTVWNNISGNQKVYEDGWEIEMLRIIGSALNISLNIVGDMFVSADLNYEWGEVTEKLKGHQLIYVGGIRGLLPEIYFFSEYTRSYFTVHAAWYTPCAVKRQRWSNFFNIFSVNMWICFALSLVLSVITVSCISNYAHKSHLHESQSYSNISSITANIIAVSLSVSVNTKPRYAPLRLFFFCWVCYSVAISTVFQAYLTTFLIEPGYEEPIKSLEQMLKSKMNFGFPYIYNKMFPDTSDPVDSEIRKNALECPDVNSCFIWASLYQNFSTILTEFEIEFHLRMKNWTDENNRPLLCELEDGVVRTLDLAILFRKRSPFFEIINDVVGRIVEGGIFLHIKKRVKGQEDLESKYDSPTFDNSYSAISISHLQTAFYLLMLGYVLALVCFVTEFMWHRYRSKVRGALITSVCHR